MFQKAFLAVQPALTWAVDAASQQTVGKAVMLSPRVVVTASHVIDGASSGPKDFMVVRWDGLWSTDILERDTDIDIAVVRLRECVSRHRRAMEPRTEFPRISERAVWYGDTVGILGHLERESEADGLRMRPMLTTGVVSFMCRRGKCHQWAIHGAFVERGFSGGPAFASDGTLVGVVTGVECICSRGPLNAPMEWPLIAPLFDFRDVVERALRATAERVSNA